MAPILEDVKKRLGDKISILKIDVDKNQQTAAAFQIRSVPTLILFKNGKILWKQAGLVPASELEKILKRNI
jgi:thioredoxin 1